MSPKKRQWFAVYTHSRAEKKVASELALIGTEHYLPLYKTLKKWSDRKKIVEEVLIRSYIFVRITEKEFLQVLQIPGVVKIIHFSGKPVPIPDWQIENLKIVLGAKVPIESDCIEFEKGQEVRIAYGALLGVRGTILRIKGQQKLVISIDALNYNMTIDIDLGAVEAV